MSCVLGRVHADYETFLSVANGGTCPGLKTYGIVFVLTPQCTHSLQFGLQIVEMNVSHPHRY